MTRELLTKKEIILDAALRLVSRKNSFSITIREIAAEAEVNVAAINYYFKSKEQLFQEMERHFSENFQDAFIPLDDDTLEKEEKLIAFLKNAISYGRHYPGMLVFLKDKFLNPDADEKDVQLKMDFISRMLYIRQLFIDVANPEEDQTGYLFMALGASLIFPFVADNYVKGLGSLMDEEEHLKYILVVLNKFKREVKR